MVDRLDKLTINNFNFEMCLLFVFLNDGTDHQVGYKMVLISNRDEYWERPTDTANFRGDDNLWIGGIDLVPGREGGTWLGINKQGKVTVLINILAVEEKNMKGRGKLVTDFVASTQISCEDYLDSVASDQQNYNPFKLILIDLREQSPCFYYLNNIESNTKQSWKVLQQRTISCDNSCNIPWCKTQHGKAKFLDILKNFGDLNCKDIMIEKYIEMLNDKTQNLPDQQLKRQFRDVGWSDNGSFFEEGSALNVFSPSKKLGTRTNTVILVDKDGNCDYVERTLETPVNVEHPKWKTVKYRFKLETDHLLNDGMNPKL